MYDRGNEGHVGPIVQKLMRQAIAYVKTASVSHGNVNREGSRLKIGVKQSLSIRKGRAINLMTRPSYDLIPNETIPRGFSSQ